MRIIGSLLILFLFISCKTDNVKESDYAYLGGEIINPNTDYVVIYNFKGTLDTVKLDRENRL